MTNSLGPLFTIYGFREVAVGVGNTRKKKTHRACMSIDRPVCSVVKYMSCHMQVRREGLWAK